MDPVLVGIISSGISSLVFNLGWDLVLRPRFRLRDEQRKAARRLTSDRPRYDCLCGHSFVYHKPTALRPCAIGSCYCVRYVGDIPPQVLYDEYTTSEPQTSPPVSFIPTEPIEPPVMSRARMLPEFTTDLPAPPMPRMRTVNDLIRFIDDNNLTMRYHPMDGYVLHDSKDRELYYLGPATSIMSLVGTSNIKINTVNGISTIESALPPPDEFKKEMNRWKTQLRMTTQYHQDLEQIFKGMSSWKGW